jgi:hypothetical protein
MSESTAALEQDSSGFFSDDDQDEAFALTGDELNNILIRRLTEEKTEEPPPRGLRRGDIPRRADGGRVEFEYRIPSRVCVRGRLVPSSRRGD